MYQIHIRALVMRVFNSLDNINRQFIWSYFIFKHVTINSKNEWAHVKGNWEILIVYA